MKTTDEGEPTARVVTREKIPALHLEVRRTSYRFSKERGAEKRRRLYLSLDGKDGDPKGFGKALGEVFEARERLVLIRSSDFHLLCNAADFADADAANYPFTGPRANECTASVSGEHTLTKRDGDLVCAYCGAVVP